MNHKKQRMVRILALAMAILLAGGAIFSAIFSFAYGEETLSPEQNQCTLTMEYMEQEQALRMSQRLVYINNSERVLDRVIFYAPANLFRRQNALPYDGEALISALPEGFLPGGIDLTQLRVNGAEADWGFQGENEAYLRVACTLEPGESCTFEFEYYLLLTENAAFMGISKEGWRLSDFYFAPASLDEGGEFILNAPLGFTRYVDAPAMDVHASITLSDGFHLAATGAESCTDGIWSIQAKNVRDFALWFGKEYKESVEVTASGVALRCLTGVRGAAKDVLAIAKHAVETCEAWFGPLPFGQLDFVQTACADGSLSHSGCLWLSEAMLKDEDALAHAVRRFVAQQYFGYSAYARPVSDAWLSDAVSEHLAYLLLEEAEGHSAYLSALNENIVPSLQLTVPGGMNVASDASLFYAEEYQIVVRDRGAAVFHELYTAMGRDDLIAGLRLFYEKGFEKNVLTEMDLVQALDAASGKSWENFLTDWVFNIGDYVNQNIDWLD